MNFYGVTNDVQALQQLFRRHSPEALDYSRCSEFDGQHPAGYGRMGISMLFFNWLTEGWMRPTGEL